MLTMPQCVLQGKQQAAQLSQAETWLILEFCDRGNLQDLVDRGGFNAVRNELGKGYAPDVDSIRCCPVHGTRAAFEGCEWAPAL